MDSFGGDENLFMRKEETKASGRIGHAGYSRLWMDDKQNRIPIKYVYGEYEGAAVREEIKRGYEEHTKRWSEQTCLTFQKIQFKENIKNEDDVLKWCFYTKLKSITEKVLLVRDTTGGTASKGISHENNICEDFQYVLKDRTYINEVIFLWSLGFLDITAQPDFEKYVRLNFENFGKLDDRGYLNTIFQCKGNATVLPVPFDYMSATMLSSEWYGNEETKPVVVTLDPSQQYLLDYRRRGQLPASFFDIMSANILYKCISDWESSCKESGKEVPKCKNFGYVTKDCTCRCSPSYSGKTCEKKTGDSFPYPTQVGAFVIEIVDDKNYDLGELLPIRTASAPGAYDDLKYNVFINVKIRPKDAERLPTIKVFVPFKKVGEILDGNVDKFIAEIGQLDCIKGMRLLWGNSKLDGRRLTCDCTSTLLANELLENSRVIRGREPDMTVTLINQLGLGFQSQELTVETSKLQLVTEFHPPPRLKNKQNFTSSANEGGNGTDATPTVPPATAAAMTASGGGGPVAAVVGAGAGLALLLLLCFLVFFLKRRKKKRQEELEEDDEDTSGSDSDEEE